jgi:hypothetical protein
MNGSGFHVHEVPPVEPTKPTLDMDDNFIMQKELKGAETVWWGSVYGCEFTRMPDSTRVLERAYRVWCSKTPAAMMPQKKGDFDTFIRSRMLAAEIRETAAGTESGVEVEEAIEHVLNYTRKGIHDLDEEGVGVWTRGYVCWIETLPGSDNGKELIVRIHELIDRITDLWKGSMAHSKITREDVADVLKKYGRQVSGRNGSVNRLRSAYALPLQILHDGFQDFNRE